MLATPVGLPARPRDRGFFMPLRQEVLSMRGSYSRLLTSESVTEGHPDKVCDRIADAVLDAHLADDPHSRVALSVGLRSPVAAA